MCALKTFIYVQSIALLVSSNEQCNCIPLVCVFWNNFLRVTSDLFLLTTVALHFVAREMRRFPSTSTKRTCRLFPFLPPSLDTPATASTFLPTGAFSAGLYNVRDVCDCFLFWETSQTFTRAYLIAACSAGSGERSLLSFSTRSHCSRTSSLRSAERARSFVSFDL